MARNLVQHERGELAHYDPAKGLKTIAVAEVAEKYFARAKDVDRLFKAVETKLKEQRKFILWWDGPELRKGGKPSQTGDGLGTAGKDGLPDRDTLRRWRTRLKAIENFADALEAAQERCRRVCEAEKGSTDQRGASGTGENEWHTPERYIEMARTALGAIDLDPASSKAAQKTVRAERYFTKADDGLTQEWRGRVWLNPPYAQPFIAQFVAKLVAEYTAGRVTDAILLTHNYTDTAWFHEAAGEASAICFTRGRIGFIDPQGNVAAPTQGQAFFYFGDDISRFAQAFSPAGFIVVPLHHEVM